MGEVRTSLVRDSWIYVITDLPQALRSSLHSGMNTRCSTSAILRSYDRIANVKVTKRFAGMYLIGQCSRVKDDSILCCISFTKRHLGPQSQFYQCTRLYSSLEWDDADLWCCRLSRSSFWLRRVSLDRCCHCCTRPTGLSLIISHSTLSLTNHKLFSSFFFLLFLVSTCPVLVETTVFTVEVFWRCICSKGYVKAGLKH